MSNTTIRTLVLEYVDNNGASHEKSKIQSDIEAKVHSCCKKRTARRIISVGKAVVHHANIIHEFESHYPPG